MKEKFIKSTFILLIGGFITKLLGMMIKIVVARLIGTEGLGMYMLILPTFMFLINLSQLGLPLALSKLIAEDKKSSKKLFFSALPILISINLVLIIVVLLLAPFISKALLHEEDVCISIMAMALVIPFTSISSICRSYFFGKQKMIPHVLSNITEDLVRLILMILIIPIILPFGLKYTVCFLILSNVISEFSSTIILLLFLPKKIKIKKEDIIPDKIYIKETLHIGIPNTTSRIIGSIAFFLEPIILTNGLLKSGYSMSFIKTEYGILSGYVIPLIVLPSFFTVAISQALLPVLSKEYANHNIKNIQKKVKLAVILCLIITVPITLLLMIKPEFFLNLIYNTTEGANYVKILAPICLLEYLQDPLSSCLDAVGKSKNNMIASLIGMTTRTVLLWVLSPLNLNLWCYVIAIETNIFCTTFYQFIIVRKFFHSAN